MSMIIIIIIIIIIIAMEYIGDGDTNWIGVLGNGPLRLGKGTRDKKRWKSEDKSRPSKLEHC